MDKIEQPLAPNGEMSLRAILREVASTERLIALILRLRAQANARGEGVRDLAALKREAEQLADLRELVSIGRTLAATMYRPGAVRAPPGRGEAGKGRPRRAPPRPGATRMERDLAQLLDYRALLEVRIREGRHPETLERDIYRFAFLGELTAMMKSFARTGVRPDPAWANARFDTAHRAARFRFMPPASPSRH